MVIIIFKMVVIILLIIAIISWACYFIIKKVKPTAINLTNDGYILVHSQKNPVAFNNANDANIYAEQTARAGIFWDVYAIFKGQILYCGNTHNLIIT